jgi:hypothetical protein
MCNKIQAWEMVELLVTTNATRQNFLDQPLLRSQEGQKVIVTGIEVFPDSVYANSQTINATPGVSAAELAKAVLTLFVKGAEKLHFIPLSKLITINSAPGGAVTPFNVIATMFDNIEAISWPQSYVQYSSAPAPSYVIPFGITYIKLG